MLRGRAAGRVGLGVFHPCHPLALHDLGHSEAIHRNRPQETFNDLLAGPGNVRGDGVRALQDAALEPASVGSFEGHSGSDHEVEQDAQRPHICVFTYVTFLVKQLRGRIGRRATSVVKDIDGAAGRAETKVAHFDAVSVGVEDVLSLQVSVHNVIIMLGKERNNIIIC